MAEVRSSAGAPAASAFGGLGSPSPGTPIVVDTTNAQAYAMMADATLVIIGSVLENRTSDPASPRVGQIWLRTDL